MKLEQKNIYQIIEKFIEIKNYKSRKDVLGIFFYGSSSYGYNTEDSDIDLHIIVSSKNDIRGNLVLDGVHVEYFERPYNKIISQMQYEKETNQTVILSMLGYGKIIYERKNKLTKLQQLIKDYYNGYTPKPLISKTKAIFDAYKIFININRLKKLSDNNDSSFYYMYYMVLNELKKLNEKLKGLSTDISQYKLKRFYLENEKQTNTFKTLPSGEFINLFLESTKLTNTKDMVISIKKVFKHVTDCLNFDFESENIILERK
ncbi:MAG: nucleotidyltransferase domain-containing protein [Clostridia bacterium]|nr:nucleotidyltransferase domain-containing protein [Clostridia bacterium]